MADVILKKNKRGRYEMNKQNKRRKRNPKKVADCSPDHDAYTNLLVYAYQKVLEAYSLEARTYAVENLEASIPLEMRPSFFAAYEQAVIDMEINPDDMTDGVLLSIKFRTLSKFVLTWLNVHGTGFKKYGATFARIE